MIQPSPYCLLSEPVDSIGRGEEGEGVSKVTIYRKRGVYSHVCASVLTISFQGSTAWYMGVYIQGFSF